MAKDTQEQENTNVGGQPGGGIDITGANEEP
jgi:hypothetical protein